MIDFQIYHDYHLRYSSVRHSRCDTWEGTSQEKPGLQEMFCDKWKKLKKKRYETRRGKEYKEAHKDSDKTKKCLMGTECEYIETCLTKKAKDLNS